MSLDNLINDILLIIINFIDTDTILRLGFCTKKYHLLSRDQNIWKQKLFSDFGIDMKLTSASHKLIETYQWYQDFPLRFKYFWAHLKKGCFYWLTPSVEKYCEESLRSVGQNEWLQASNLLGHRLNRYSSEYMTAFIHGALMYSNDYKQHQKMMKKKFDMKLKKNTQLLQQKQAYLKYTNQLISNVTTRSGVETYVIFEQQKTLESLKSIEKKIGRLKSQTLCS